MQGVVDALQVHCRHAERILHASLGESHREPHPIEWRVKADEERARLWFGRLGGRANPEGELAHPFGSIGPIRFKVCTRKAMDTLLLVAPLLRGIRAQLYVEALLRVVDEAGADADQAPIEWRLARALNVNAEPELLREPLFKRGWRRGVVLRLAQPTP